MKRKNTAGIMRRDYCDNGEKSENSGQRLRMECKGFREKGTAQLIVTAFMVSMIVLSSLSCLYDLWPWENEGGLGQPCYAGESCDSPYICVEGICEPACESLEESCAEEGYEECLEEGSGFRSCGYYTEEYPECLVWGETEFCEKYEVCIEGECLNCGDEGEPCCVNSVCNTGFQCNDETWMCEEHSCTGLSIEECGNCGVRTRTCEDGEWSDWGECIGEGTCSVGTNGSRACGNCGTQTRECSSSCEWGEWGTCTGEGICTPDDIDTETCGNCGNRMRICTSGCGWGNWSSCTGQGECEAGSTDTQDCGNCGTQTRECTTFCGWGTWGTCTEERECEAGSVEERDCGNCGTQTRTCTSSCEWEGWGACTGEGTCAVGTADSRVCGNCETQTRECSSLCEWGDWGDCQNDCWLDSISNLTWQVEPTGGRMNLGNAIAHCQGLSLYGVWRLPTIIELRSLIRGCAATVTGGSCNIGEGCMALNCREHNSCDGCSQNQGPEGGCYWPGEMTGTCARYWSSSPVEDSDNNAWIVNFSLGNVHYHYTSNDSHVRCVRIDEMVTVPAGPYWMGCNEAVDDDCHSDGREEPYHEVNVPVFKIDKYQVTQRLYRACVDAGDCTEPETGSYCNWNHTDREEHPANCITWHQAREYCEWAGKRLCSEAEWEKAARGTDGRKYPWGNDPATCDYAIFNEDGGDSGRGCGEDRTWPVGSKPQGASPYSALDMAGNVWEWVEDDWYDNYNGAPTDGSARVESPRKPWRVVRGGSFSYSAEGLRASRRGGGNPNSGTGGISGTRCCR